MASEVRDIPYAGWTVARICVDFEFGLALEPEDPAGENAWVRIGGAFEYQAPDGSRYDMRPGPPQEPLAPALGLHTRRVTRFAVSADGHLEIAFADGASLSVSPDEQFEAWQVEGPVDLLCGPGGGTPWAD